MIDNIDEFTLNPESESRRSKSKNEGATAALLIGLGGTGSEILRRLKPQFARLGVSHLFRFLVVDTDETAFRGSRGLPGFERSEYIYLDYHNAARVMEHPDLHDAVASRFDLIRDEDVHRELHVKMQQIGESMGCGQVRPIGALRFCANYALFKDMIQNVAGELRDIWGDLRASVAGLAVESNDLDNRLPVLVFSSVCGGTGSSMLIDVLASLQADLDEIDTQCYLTMPNVYEKAIDDAQRIRTLANSYANLVEYEYFQQGLAAAHGVTFPTVGQNPDYGSPVSLASMVYLIHRVDARGGDLREDSKVFDAIALGITSEYAMPIGGKIRSQHVNNIANTLADKDVQTNQVRRFSTLGATAIAIPSKRILSYGAAYATRKTLEASILGSAPPPEDVTKDISSWLREVEFENRQTQGAHLAAEAIYTRVFPDIERRVNELYQVDSSGTREHHSDKQFMRLLDQVIPKLKNAPRQFEIDAKAALSELKQEFNGHLDAHVQDETRARGLRYMTSFLAQLERILERLGKTLRDAADDSAWSRDSALEQVPKASKPMQGLIGSLGTDISAQNRVARHLEDFLEGHMAVITHSGMAELADDLIRRIKYWQTRLSKSVKALERLRSSAQELEEESLALAQELFADSSIEVSLLSPDETEGIVAEFFDQKIDVEALVEEVRQKIAVTDWLDAYGHEDFGDQLLRTCARRYLACIGNLNAASILMDRLNDPAKKTETRIRIEQTLKACRPLWQAGSPAVQEFSESILVGIPAPEGSPEWNAVTNIILAVQASLMLPGYTIKDISFETCPDTRKIYVTRRSHGARPHFLPWWKNARSAYEKLSKSRTNHISLHTWPEHVVRNFPSLEPRLQDKGDLAFALGMAMGWIAKRGQFYFFNLVERRSSDGSTTVFEVPTKSQWPSLAEDSGLFDRLIEKGIFQFPGRDRAESELKLANGRENAMKELKKSEDRVSMILQAFDTLQQLEGTSQVAGSLDAYVKTVDARGSSSDDLRDQLSLEIELIRGEAERIATL